MLSILDLAFGEEAVVMDLPNDLQTKQALLVHGIHIGGTLKLVQRYSAQDLALIIQNGRKIALRQRDCLEIKVVKVNE